MPTFFGGIHRQVALGEVEGHLTGLTFINMHAPEAFQQLGGWGNGGDIIADI